MTSKGKSFYLVARIVSKAGPEEHNHAGALFWSSCLGQLCHAAIDPNLIGRGEEGKSHGKGKNENKIKSSVGIIFNKREYNWALLGRQPVMHLCCCGIANV